MKKILLILLSAVLLLSSCSAGEIITTSADITETEAEETTVHPDNKQEIDEILGKMTVEEKVGQMFMVTPEALRGAVGAAQLNGNNGAGITEVDEDLKNAIDKYAPAGIVLFAQNITDPEQIKKFNKDLHESSRQPLIIAVDEEGGRVARVAGNDSFSVQRVGSMENIGKTGDTNKAFETGYTIGAYLKEYGFDLDLAPVADVNTNDENSVIGDRSFGSDPVMVGEMVSSAIEGFDFAGVSSCVKHFPGHGATAGDTHTGNVVLKKTWEEMLESDIVPFKAAIDNGVRFIMAAHICCPEITGDYTPASVSHTILTEKLRGELGYDGLILTDAMNMGAITNKYSSSAAAVAAVNAGVDLVLAPYDFVSAYNGLLDAVNNGTITVERIDESVRRILEVKLK